MQSIKLVEEFQKTFGNAIPDKPTMPSAEIVNFRIAFMIEELNELKAAFEKGDLVEFADGCGDLQYVLDGLFLDAGLHNKKEAILTEIHRSNMSKVCNTHEEAYDTMVAYKKRGVNSHINDMGNGQYTVVRAYDNKVMKSINYSKPNLYPIIYPF